MSPRTERLLQAASGEEREYFNSFVGKSGIVLLIWLYWTCFNERVGKTMSKRVGEHMQVKLAELGENR